MDSGLLKKLLEEGIQEKVFPGAAAAIGTAEGTTFAYAGKLTYDPNSSVIDANTLWDLASLTKVMATWSAALILWDEGSLELDNPVVRFLPGFAGPHKGRVTVRHLLLHNSGLPAYKNLEEHFSSEEEVLKLLMESALDFEPGDRSVYSCVGFIILQKVLEVVAGEPLDQFFGARIAKPLCLEQTSFRPTRDQCSRCAPTAAYEIWRKVLRRKRRVLAGLPEETEEPIYLQGEVHDPLAWLLGGVSGNAGLFSTAQDVGRFMQWILRGGEAMVEPSSMAEWTAMDSERSERALGWDSKSSEGSSAGSLFSANSFGHTGFTGTSIWIDPERQVFATLLTNRIHPDSQNERIRGFRPRFHDEVMKLLT